VIETTAMGAGASSVPVNTLPAGSNDKLRKVMVVKAYNARSKGCSINDQFKQYIRKDQVSNLPTKKKKLTRFPYRTVLLSFASKMSRRPSSYQQTN
jgi:hypothetical protein